MSNLLFGRGYLTSIGDAVLTPTGAPAGYVTPLIPAPEVVDEADEIKMLKDLFGHVEGIICPDDCILTATFAFIPRSKPTSPDITRASATLSAALPLIGQVLITGLPIIQVRKFTDAFNTNAASTQPWFYFGGGSIKGAEDGKEWTGTITLKRFFGINVGGGIVG